MKKTNGIIPLALLSLLVLATVPPANASTLMVTINPTSKSAELQSISSTTIVLTYPSGSTLSMYLSNVSTSVSYTSSFTGGSYPVLALQSGFAIRDRFAQLQNTTISYSEVAKGNATALVIHKDTNITAWVSGLFTIVNGTVHVDLGWRAFAVPGNMTLNFNGQMVDVNLVGSAVAYPLRGHPIIRAFLSGRFGGSQIWDWATLNFTALDTPLTTWTRNYDSSTNTTTFSKTISGTSSFRTSADYNGQKYSLTVSSDPSAKIATQGYATASADSLSITSAPGTASLSATDILAIGAAVVVIAAIGTLYVLKSRTMRPGKQSINIPSVNQ